LGKLIALYYTRLEKYLLNQSDHIVLIAKDFEPVIKKWTYTTSISVIENWAPLDEIKPHPKNNPWSISQGFNDKFCFMYSGTLGLKHNPTLLLELAKHYQHDKNIIIAIISEGIGAEWLQREARHLGLANLRFYDYVDYEKLPTVLSSADVLLAILEKNAGSFCVPSKVLSYHCIGRPLLLSVPKENLASEIVISSNSGLVVKPDDYIGFCSCADRLKTDSQLRYKMGQNAFNFARCEFDIDKKCDSFIRIFR
jgi:glycosyltransferase involved in cell wall biosynthesis